MNYDIKDLAIKKKSLASYLTWLDLASEVAAVSKTVRTGRFKIQVILAYASEAWRETEKR